jgi:hypothetical protein
VVNVNQSTQSSNYVTQGSTEENKDISDKYVSTGESEFSRESIQPIDEVLSERHYILSGVQSFFRDRFKQEKGFSGVGPKNYQRSDVRILEDVNDALMRSTQVDPSDIEVSVDRGTVYLDGYVMAGFMKKTAEALAMKVYGVKNIINSLHISTHGRPLVNSNNTGLN